MKFDFLRITPLAAIAAGALLIAPPATAATAANGDIMLGFRADSGTGSTKTYVINLGAASQFESATNALTLSLGPVGADLSATYGASWYERSNLMWGAAGTVGSFTAIGSNPAKTVWGTRAVQTAWLRQNDATHGAVTNRLVALNTAFNVSSSSGVSANNAVLQTVTDINNWASYQPGGNNAGPAPGTSFAFFNPSIEANFGGGVGGAILHLYRVKPATTGAEINTASDYLGRFIITQQGQLTFVPVAAFGSNTVAVESATYSVNEADGTVDVKVVRTGDLSSTASVSIAVTGGTAGSPDDFSFTGGVVSFGVGEAEKTETISVVDRAGFQGDRTIVLALSNPTNATLGATASTTVTIAEAIEPSVINLVDANVDVHVEAGVVGIKLQRSGGQSPVTIDVATSNGTAAAGVDFVAPTGGAQTASFGANVNEVTVNISLLNAGAAQNRTFTVTLTNAGPNASAGTTPPTSTVVRILAADSTAPTVAISTPAANATIPAAGNPTVTMTGTANDNVALDRVEVRLNGGSFANATLGGSNWSRTITPAGGLNTVEVRAFDTRGNVSATVSRSFTYLKTGPLTVVTSPADGSGGSVSGALAGATAYQVGRTYTLRANAKNNFSFHGWNVPGLAANLTESPVLTFVYTDAILASPTITATFVASPFDATKAGDFHGLVTPHIGTASTHSTHGFAKITLTGSGKFTGSLLIDGYKLTLPGSVFTATGGAFFGPKGENRVWVERGNKPALELADLRWNSASNTITGTIKQYYRKVVIAESRFTLDRAPFSAKNKLPAASPYLANGGLFNVIIPTKAQTNGLLPEEYPQGDGVGAITVSANGILKLAAKLADDTSVTASAPLNAALQAPLFAQIYSNRGSYTAMVQLDSTAAASDLKAINTVWFRPWQNKMQWYPWGWEEGLSLDLLGANYNAKAATPLPGLQQPANTTIANAELAFSGGLLAETLVLDVNIDGKGAVKTLTNANGTDKSFKLTLSTAKGDISGSFTHSDGTAPKFVGKVYQKGPQAGAYGFFLTVKPKEVDGLGESGGVTLSAKP
jgi:hypothetical protein